MTTTTISPEVQAALERLNTLPGHLVPDRLRAGLVDAAAAIAQRREHAEQVAEASAAATVAGQSGDVAAAALAASRLAALEILGRFLPPIELAPGTVAEALQGAQEAVRLARGEVPPVADVAYVLELRAWHSLGGLPVQVTGSVPESIVTDLTARAQADQVRAEQANLAASIETWARGQGEVLTLLGVAASLITQCADLAQRTAVVNAIVKQANDVRRASGLCWRVPDSYGSSAVRDLKEFRAAESALEAAI